jgi:hypothetical protein
MLLLDPMIIFDIVIMDSILLILMTGGMIAYNYKQGKLIGFIAMDFIEGQLFKNNYPNSIFMFMRKSES